MPDFREKEIIHDDAMQDIISDVPSWILRWGISVTFVIISFVIVLSALVKYPEIVKTELKIYSPNSPKPVVAKISGRIVKMLCNENQYVRQGQPLAYIESTANHDLVLKLLLNLKSERQKLLVNKRSAITINSNMEGLGELQESYQAFFQSYLEYKSVIDNGFKLQKLSYYKRDRLNLEQQRKQLFSQKDIEQKDLDLSNQEFEMHKSLAKEKVETIAELRQAESKLLLKRSPVIQTEASLIASKINIAAKEKEILELTNEIDEGKARFLQAISSLISQIDNWKEQYVLCASQNGILSFSGVVQKNQIVDVTKSIFFINPGNEFFFGELPISQNDIGKVKVGQEVLIKLKGYPFEEYGVIIGSVSSIADIPDNDGQFIAKVNFKLDEKQKQIIHLKEGMLANADVITQQATFLQRCIRNLKKMMI